MQRHILGKVAVLKWKSGYFPRRLQVEQAEAAGIFGL